MRKLLNHTESIQVGTIVKQAIVAINTQKTHFKKKTKPPLKTPIPDEQ